MKILVATWFDLCHTRRIMRKNMRTDVLSLVVPVNPDKTDADIRTVLSKLEEKQNAIERAAHRLVVGRKVKIVGDWNGQPYGNSKPSRKGQEFTVSGIVLSNGQWSSVSIAEYPIDSPPYLNQVEFLD